ERSGEEQGAEPRLPRPERVVGEGRKAGRRIECRDDSEAGTRNRHQHKLAGAVGAQPLGRAARAALVRIADDEPADDAGEPDQLGDKRGHEAQTEAAGATAWRRGVLLSAPSAETKSRNPSGAIVQSTNATGPHTIR